MHASRKGEQNHVRKKTSTGPRSEIPKIDLNQWLSQLIDHFMWTWNHRLEQQLAAIRLTFPQWRVLFLSSQMGPMTIQQLSDATLVPHSTLARWVRHMERAGLVESQPHAEDGRAVQIVITSQGRRLFGKAFPIAQQVYEDALAGFSGDERKRLFDFVHRMRRNIGME